MGDSPGRNIKKTILRCGVSKLYYDIPLDINSNELYGKDNSWSPSQYKSVLMDTDETKEVKQLLDQKIPYDMGIEPGSKWYMEQQGSTHFFIRTKALQSHTCLLYPKGDSIIPLNPQKFEIKRKDLQRNDILLSKDSNIGESAIIFSDNWINHTFSKGIVRLNPKIDPYYLFSFLKHPIFKAQLLVKTPRGSTIKHAGKLWLECLIPFPIKENTEKGVQYVSKLMQTIIAKEHAIRTKHNQILEFIEKELLIKRKGNSFSFTHLNSKDLAQTMRMDTGIYCKEFKIWENLIENYYKGFTTLSNLGILTRRGPNLAVSCIGKSLYSNKRKKGWYELIRPVNISEYGHLIQQEWLGNKKELPLLNEGDIVFGCEGFEKGRTYVNLEKKQKCTTNFHGTVLYSEKKDLDITNQIFIRCFLAFLKEKGILDLVSVGGSGGHLAPIYFDYLPIPIFPKDVQKKISQLYHNSTDPPKTAINFETFVQTHDKWNENVGIFELRIERNKLYDRLLAIQQQIIKGQSLDETLVE